jgi:hypothetical protein
MQVYRVWASYEANVYAYRVLYCGRIATIRLSLTISYVTHMRARANRTWLKATKQVV